MQKPIVQGRVVFPLQILPALHDILFGDFQTDDLVKPKALRMQKRRQVKGKRQNNY